jgi:transcriptional regulator with XRE-family HTH domain
MTRIQAKRLGRIIGAARRRRGLSIRVLAAELDAASSWLTELEHGHFVDPAPDRLARLAEMLDIEPAQIDRITRGSMADSLPEVRTYFRAKYGFTSEESEQVARYVKRLRKGTS